MPGPSPSKFSPLLFSMPGLDYKVQRVQVVLCSRYVVSVAEGMYCDFAKFRRLAFYGPTEFSVSSWVRHAV